MQHIHKKVIRYIRFIDREPFDQTIPYKITYLIVHEQFDKITFHSDMIEANTQTIYDDSICTLMNIY